MKITLQKPIPKTLESMLHSKDSIWLNHTELNKGEKIIINAESGKGKTTFTHVLSGVRRSFSGQILFDDKNIADFNIDDWIKIRTQTISTIYQDLLLFPELTVIENILIKNSLKESFSIDKIDHFLNEIGIIEKKNKPCSQLSMGQCQRVAIVRALCQPFKWIVMDEPFSHLDNKNTEIAFNLITQRCMESSSGMILTSLDKSHITHFDKELFL